VPDIGRRYRNYLGLHVARDVIMSCEIVVVCWNLSTLDAYLFTRTQAAGVLRIILLLYEPFYHLQDLGFLHPGFC